MEQLAQMQSELIDAVSSEMVLTVKAALGPVLQRIESLERERTVSAEKIAVLEHRLAVAEAREPIHGTNGKDADLETVSHFVVEQVEKGISAVRDELIRVAAEQAQSAVAAIPVPQNGKDGEPGKSIDTAEVERMVVDACQKFVDAIPRPQDGKSVTVDELAPLVAQEVTKAMSAIPVPKDGVGISGTLLDRQGHLVLTLSDGTVKDVGLVTGKDADPADIQRIALEEFAKLPKPQDGAPGRDGKDGRDGILENVKLAQLDERTWQWQFKDGTPIEGGTMRFAVVLDRGVYSPEKAYETGDGVTLSGSFWIAQAETKSRPGTPDGAKDWRLAVKAGRDGKEGKAGPEGKPGPRGEKGMDGRNGY